MSITNNPRRGYRTLRLPIPQSIYERFIDDVSFARTIIDQCYTKSPEIFPDDFSEGYIFNGLTTPSVKQGYQCRRMTLKANKVTFMVTPVFLMPYMTALTEEVEKTLFLRRFNVPFWGLTYVSGRNDMFWYRLEQSLGRLNIVGTTVKDPELLPKDLLADEKHTRLKENKHYIAMTVAKDCILEAAMTDSASEEALREGYGVFGEEARSVDSLPYTFSLALDKLSIGITTHCLSPLCVSNDFSR